MAQNEYPVQMCYSRVRVSSEDNVWVFELHEEYSLHVETEVYSFKIVTFIVNVFFFTLVVKNIVLKLNSEAVLYMNSKDEPTSCIISTILLTNTFLRFIMQWNFLFSLGSVTPRCSLWVLQGHHICFSVPENPETKRWFATSIKCCSEVQSFVIQEGKRDGKSMNCHLVQLQIFLFLFFISNLLKDEVLLDFFFVMESTAWDLYVWNFPDCDLFDNNGEICLFSCSVPTVIKDLDGFLLVSHIVSDGKKV